MAMGKGWAILILLLVCRLDAWALSPANKLIDSYPQLSRLVNQYNAIDKFNKNLLAKRVQILVKISKTAAALYRKNPQDVTLGEIHETYFKEAQELISILNNQKNNLATEVKFSSRARRILKARQSVPQKMRITALTPFGQTLSHNRENFSRLPDLSNQMDLSSLMADKALTGLQRPNSLEQNFQDFKGGGLSFSPPSRDMDVPYVPQQAPRRLAQQQRRDNME